MRHPIDKDVLIQFYEKERLSMRAIAKKLGRSDATVLFYMREYGIKSRPQHQLKGRPKSKIAIERHRKSLMGYKHTAESSAKKSKATKGKVHPWASKRRLNRSYIQLYEPNNPMSDSGGYVYEHRKVMGESIGRPLLKTELIHHRNGIKTDNRLENLQIVTRFEHAQLHSGEIQCPHCLNTFRYVSQINSARSLHVD